MNLNDFLSILVSICAIVGTITGGAFAAIKYVADNILAKKFLEWDKAQTLAFTDLRREMREMIDSRLHRVETDLISSVRDLEGSVRRLEERI